MSGLLVQKTTDRRLFHKPYLAFYSLLQISLLLQGLKLKHFTVPCTHGDSDYPTNTLKFSRKVP